MAINPNTDFAAGAVLTNAQQNRFPRGVMAFNTATATDSTITSEEVQITGSSFTAVANRYYKITYYEPGLGAGGSTDGNARIRLTNLAGAVQQLQSFPVLSTGGGFVHMTAITTLSAGTTNFVATLSATANVTATRSATRYAFLLVEDIGPA
jgi:tripartite-type tricarboxylate transporter receptor subunit TctC